MSWWGGFVCRHRRWVLLAALVAFAGSAVVLAGGGSLKNSSTFNFESNRGFSLEDQQLPSVSVTGVTLVMSSSTVTVGTPAYAAAVHSALAQLAGDSRVQSISLPPLDDPAAQSPQIAPDRHAIAVQVALRTDNFATATQEFPSLRDEVHSSQLTVHAAGDVALNSAFNVRSEQDLERADISIPAALVVLVIVFGSAVAALLCLSVGLMAVAGGLAAMYQLAHHTDVSTFALNVVVIVGLGVAIDYSLFLVSRFREELRRQGDVEAALRTTMRTAGTAVAFSGLTVAVGVSGLLFYGGTILSSMGLAGSFVVAISVIYALAFLPAMLAILGDRVNRWRPSSLLRPLRRRPATAPPTPGASGPTAGTPREGFWHRLATTVMRHPVPVLLPCLAVLLLMGSPFLQMNLAEANVTLLPPGDDARQGTEQLAQEFSEGNPIDVVLDFHGSPYATANVAAAYGLARRLDSFPGISKVESYVDVPGVSALTAYQGLYAGGEAGLAPQLRSQVAPLTGSSIAVLRFFTPYAVEGSQADSLVRELRSHDQTAGAQVSVTGNTAFNLDYVAYMLGRTPWAAVYIMLTTFVLLMILLRSLVLPLKAVVMNLLSLSAAFGALVWIFQQGHLSGALDFSPASLDPTVPVLLFCAIFGLSMDYEVFLLTRMREAWDGGRDNRGAVADGLEASGRLVTGAAAIMVTVFAVFGLVSSVVVIKALGLGMAIAVFIDASVVRALVVPAVMRLIGPVNWWAPRWMRRRSDPPEAVPG